MVEGREQALKTTLKVKMVEDVVKMMLFRFPINFESVFNVLGESWEGLGALLGRSWVA